MTHSDKFESLTRTYLLSKQSAGEAINEYWQSDAIYPDKRKRLLDFAIKKLEQSRKSKAKLERYKLILKGRRKSKKQ